MLRVTRLLSRQEGGQIAVAGILLVFFLLILGALALDAGLWYFDHRTAQNQAEAASLAAVQELPAADPEVAFDKASEWLDQNDVDPTLSVTQSGNCSGIAPGEVRVVFTKVNSSQFNQVRVCIRRESPALLGLLTGNIANAVVSAGATAMAGPADLSNVMPWAVVPFDAQCNDVGEMCDVDENGNGQLDAGESGVCTFLDCPFGLDPDRLLPLKSDNNNNCSTQSCPMLAIQACGSGTSNYTRCITGTATTSGFEVGEEVTVETAPGNLGQNTASALNTWASANGDPGKSCGISSTPDPTQGGLDPDTVTGELATKKEDPDCQYRKVVLAIVCYEAAANCLPPNGMNSLTVYGLAVYYVAGWTGPQNTYGSTNQACGSAGNTAYNCGVVWGYLLEGEDPAARFNLERIGQSNNPFAPIVLALTE